MSCDSLIQSHSCLHWQLVVSQICSLLLSSKHIAVVVFHALGDGTGVCCVCLCECVMLLLSMCY